MDQTKFLSTKTQITNFHNHCEDNGCCLLSKQSYAVKFDAMGENNLHDPSWFSSEEREGNENGNAELTWLNHCDQNPWIVSAILENIPSRPRPRLKGTLFFSSRRSLRNDIMKNRKGRGGGELLGSASRLSCWTCWTLPKTVFRRGEWTLFPAHKITTVHSKIAMIVRVTYFGRNRSLLCSLVV